MKKIISTQGLTFGEHVDDNISKAINWRVSPRLEALYQQLFGEPIHTAVTLSFEVMDGEIKNIALTYLIDSHDHERLSNFRDACNIFFSLHGFVADYDDESVYFSARDIYDMASLIHALDAMTVSLESVMCAVPDDIADTDDLYTPSGDTIIQIPNVPKYRIKDGAVWISPNALKYCNRLKHLDIPYGMTNHREILDTYAPKVSFREWETLYDGTLPDETVDDEDDDNFTLDKHHVAYSKDGKKLLFARVEFCETRYEVPDGVEEIDDYAFTSINTYLELVIPRSVRRIGDALFGAEGHITIRD